jgi:hypothetical protein
MSKPSRIIVGAVIVIAMDFSGLAAASEEGCRRQA